MPDDIPLVRNCISNDHKAIVVSFGSGDVNGVFDIAKITDHSCHVLDKILWDVAEINKRPNVTRREQYEVPIQIPFEHGITAPNQVLLESLGFNVKGEPGVVLSEHARAEKAVVDTFNLVIDVLQLRKSEAVVYLPAVKAPFYDFKSQLWNQILRRIPIKVNRQFVQLLFRNSSYSGGDAPAGFYPNAAMRDPLVRCILRTRKAELIATSSAVALMCTVESMPSLRLSNKLNLFSSYYKSLEYFSKLDGEKPKKQLQKKFAELNAELTRALGNDTRQSILGLTTACTICADAPIEWTYLGSLPLMISHEVSKIPMTPGNILLQSIASGSRFILPAQAFRKVLVIRSFSDGDPLKKILERAISGFPLSDAMQVKFVDVQTEAELISALNSYDGHIVVFDCHGDHGGTGDVGWLQIGNERVVTWELAHRARIPPIVMLSACLTSAVGGSHASVATGLLGCGALSVIGTLLAVNGIHSAIFMARIVYRMDAFLNALQKMKITSITWRTFIAGFFRMSYMTDVLRYFCKDLNLISQQISNEIHLEANININSLNPDWYSAFLERLAVATELATPTILEKILVNQPLMETMRYCQLGMPEKIVIDLTA